MTSRPDVQTLILGTWISIYGYLLMSSLSTLLADGDFDSHLLVPKWLLQILTSRNSSANHSPNFKLSTISWPLLRKNTAMRLQSHVYIKTMISSLHWPALIHLHLYQSPNISDGHSTTYSTLGYSSRVKRSRFFMSLVLICGQYVTFSEKLATGNPLCVFFVPPFISSLCRGFCVNSCRLFQ